MTKVLRSIRIEPDLWAFIEDRAKVRNITPSAWLRRCVEDARKRMTKADD